VHGRPTATQLAADAALGATTEATMGNATAETPSVRINSRRDVCGSRAGPDCEASSKLDCSSCFMANRTVCSDTAAFIFFSISRATVEILLRPSQCFQTNAAV